MAKRAPKGTPTDLNIDVLRELFRNRNAIPNKIEAVHLPHLRRCLKAGLILPNKATGELVLTAEGRAVLDANPGRKLEARMNTIYKSAGRRPEDIDYRLAQRGGGIIRRIYPGEVGFDLTEEDLQKIADAFPDTWDHIVKAGGEEFERAIERTRHLTASTAAKGTPTPGDRVEFLGDRANDPKSGEVVRVESGYMWIRWDDGTTENAVPTGIVDTPRWRWRGL